MLGGQALIHCYYPSFPDSVVNKTTPDRELTDVRIRYRLSEEAEIVEETRQLRFTLLGRNQLAYTDIPEEEIILPSDRFEVTFFDACLVTPHDPIIRYLTQRIQQRMGGSNAISGRREDVEKFFKAVYDTLADCGVRSQIFPTNNHAWPAVQLSDGSYLAVEATMLGDGSFDQAFEVGFMRTMAHLNGDYFETKTQDDRTLSESLVPMQVMDGNQAPEWVGYFNAGQQGLSGVIFHATLANSRTTRKRSWASVRPSAIRNTTE